MKEIQEKKGIIPRAMEHILGHIERTSNTTKYKLYCSYMEIYNEKIYDLLNMDDKNVHLDIREDRNRGLYVQDLTTILVTKAQDIYELMQEGARNRSVAQTDMNERSSRSHTIFQLIMEQEPLKPSTLEEKVSKLSKLNLVDLAGSEKWNTFSKIKMEDKRIQELTSINQSLSTLGVWMHCVVVTLWIELYIGIDAAWKKSYTISQFQTYSLTARLIGWKYKDSFCSHSISVRIGLWGNSVHSKICRQGHEGRCNR